MASRIDKEIELAAAIPLPDEDDDNMDWSQPDAVSGCFSLVLAFFFEHAKACISLSRKRVRTPHSNPKITEKNPTSTGESQETTL
jgi:hypothetical protein